MLRRRRARPRLRALSTPKHQRRAQLGIVHQRALVARAAREDRPDVFAGRPGARLLLKDRSGCTAMDPVEFRCVVLPGQGVWPRAARPPASPAPPAHWQSRAPPGPRARHRPRAPVAIRNRPARHRPCISRRARPSARPPRSNNPDRRGSRGRCARQLRRADEVAEQHRQLASLGLRSKLSRACGGSASRRDASRCRSPATPPRPGQRAATVTTVPPRGRCGRRSARSPERKRPRPLARSSPSPREQFGRWCRRCRRCSIPTSVDRG
jgi:hypothetical protein